MPARTGRVRLLGRTTLVYSGLLATGSVALAVRSRAGRADWLLWASTNLDNLHHHPVAALVLSAFLPQDHGVVWVALALVGLGGAERSLGSVRTAVLVAVGHLAGTAVSEGILAYRVHSGALPEQARQILDVGPSFVVVTGLLAAVVAGRGWTRIVAAGGCVLLGPALLQGVTRLDVAAVGHLCAAVIGAVGAAGFRIRQGGRGAPTR